jgi:hypothetical protein
MLSGKRPRRLNLYISKVMIGWPEVGRMPAGEFASQSTSNQEDADDRSHHTRRRG